MKAVLSLALVATAWARCNNDCSGNGFCNHGSVCECNLNFMGNDCSNRLCLYGKAFIDSPLGDLNGNSRVDTDQQIRYQYSNGLVGEQYDPAYALARGDNTKQWNEAHFYRECSNKGICDRSTGQCACFPGFEGEGCRRITCPNSCSGHGQCVNLAVSNAEYKAWDHKKSVRCECDPGYTSADCSLRKCPMGTDPIRTVHINDNSVYKIEWKQKADKKWKEDDDGAPAEHPNGQVHWTMSYTDDFGDVWTTSAVTTYYQTRTEPGSLIIGPSDSTNKLISTPFFMDPDYQGAATKTVNVDGGLKLKDGTPEGTGINSVYTGKAFSYHPSFIGEQVNASLQALPNDLVRFSYVHTVYNFGADADKVFIYPSMGVPLFKTKLKDKTLKAGTPGSDGGKTLYMTGAGVCSPDSDTLAAADCANAGNFNDGKSKAVNDAKYRFPYFLASDDTTEGDAALAKKYTNCDTNALCIFITLGHPAGQKDMVVNYKFKTLIRTAGADEVAMKPNEYEETLAREIANHDKGKNSLVTVTQVGTDRKWHGLIDGTPTVAYSLTADDKLMHDCSRRGLCDFETGKCKCFDGYSGYKCNKRSVQGY